MKKVLSFVLSIAMVVCLMPTMAFAATTSASQAAAAYSDTQGTACEGAVNVLTALKVVDGFTDGTYKPEQTVTRAQMAKLIVTALGVADYATAKTSKFVDMGAATWAIPYVEYAANLNIVNGVGNGKFNPNGLVTYEQAATMIVRALGYTDQCKEMNGTWPAIYIQKAMALNIFEDVVNGGKNGANRGDVAIMLYNALDLAQVYADADGATHYKTGNNAARYNGDIVSGVSMMGTLNKNGKQEYEVISSSDADTALTDVRQYVGAAAKVTKDKNGDILAVGDIKTTFLTGDVSDDGKKITVNDKDYDIDNVDFVTVNPTTGGKDTTKGAIEILNGKTVGTYITSSGAFKAKYAPNTGGKNVTIAAKVSGITVKEVYSIATWETSRDAQVSESDVNQITRNKKLLTKEFDKNDDGDVDTASFVLNGVNSLSEIKEDNIVYVYTANNETNGKIRRVDVGTKVVSGEITKKTSSKVTIDGTAYKFSSKSGAESIDNWSTGDTVKAYLDYSGKIYAVEFLESTAGNYAVVFSKSTKAPDKSATESDAKVQLVTGDGNVTVFNIDGDKFVNNVEKNKSTTWGAITAGSLVKYETNSSNKITKIYRADGNIYNPGKTEAANKVKTTDLFKSTTEAGVTAITATTANVTKSGYITKSGIDNTAIADNAVIFTLKTSGGAFDFSDSDDAGVTTLDKIKNTKNNLMSAVVNDKHKVVAIIIAEDSSSDDTYGIVTSTYDLKDNDTGADFYIGTEKMTDKTVDGDVEVSIAKKVTSGALYKVKQTASGKYTFKDKTTETELHPVATSIATATSSAAVKIDNGYIVKGDDSVALTGKSRLSIASNAVIYIYDKSDDNYTIGTKSDLTDEDMQYIYFYETDGQDDDNYGLVTYVVAYRK